MKLTTNPSRNNEAMIRIAPRAESNKRRPSVDRRISVRGSLPKFGGCQYGYCGCRADAEHSRRAQYSVDRIGMNAVYRPTCTGRPAMVP